MRTMRLLLGDIRFQYKYGFYFLYAFFSVFYMAVLYALPEAWREVTAVVMIFSDPAALGLFFMGAIVLFEKSERVLDSLAVSPVRAWEYTLSKLASLGLISVCVALAIGIPAGIVTRPILFTVGVFSSSCLFSALGLIAASRSSTLNQFMLVSIPFEIVVNIPPYLWLIGTPGNWLLAHPGVCMMEILLGRGNLCLTLATLLLWTALISRFACHTAGRMIRESGGARL